MAYIVQEYCNGKWFMLNDRFDTLAEAKEYVKDTREFVRESELECGADITDAIYRILDEKDTEAGSLTIQVDGQTLHRAEWDAINDGDEFYIFNMKDVPEALKWVKKKDYETFTRKDGLEMRNDPIFECFTKEDRYSIEWKKYDALESGKRLVETGFFTEETEASFISEYFAELDAEYQEKEWKKLFGDDNQPV